MAKNKNKGFSLVEIIIAIAVLTLLLTPILKQLAATMSTNRKAKEQQYAVENAEYVLQYVQSTDLDVLGDTSITTGDVYCVSKKISDGDTVAGNEGKHTCKVYVLGTDASGNVTAVDSSETIEYSTFEYELNPVELGYRNTEYSRRVVLDDISNRVKTLETAKPDSDGDGKDEIYTYAISYNNETAVEGFTLTSEGSMVQYDTNGYVSAIVCDTFMGLSSTDPNQLNMGNMHNFDYTQMALINGYTTDYDEQAADDFYAEAMDLLKNSSLKTDNQTWENALYAGAKLSTDIYLDGMVKLTTLSITKDEAAKCYEVKVTVVYENTIGLGSSTKHVQKEYENVYAQKFPYDDESELPPEIYFEYQPMSSGFLDVADNPNTPVNEAEYSFTYAENDYLIIDNQVENAKIYLVKPKWDQARIFTHEITDLAVLSNDTTSEPEDIYYYYNLGNKGTGTEVSREHITNNDKVRINISSANSLAVEGAKKFTIYTNLVLVDSVTSDTQTSTDPQFVLNNNEVYDSAFKIEGNKRTAYDVPGTYLKSMADEETKGNRLYTATVTLTPDNEGLNTVIFTGAKGAN